MQYSLKINQILALIVVFISQINALAKTPIGDPDFGITVPGTKWCGPGNTASSYEDLGTQRETDMCCRDHDHCELILTHGSTQNGLTNTGLLPILDCSCEEEFRNCLQNVNNLVANTLGHAYFGARKQCMAEGYPIVDCAQYQQGRFGQRCIEYNTDETQPQLWQFYDMAYYSSSSQS